MAENLPKLTTDTKSQIQGAEMTPKKINTKNIYTLRHIILQLQRTKDKEEILKKDRGKQPFLERMKIKITRDFSSETMQGNY